MAFLHALEEGRPIAEAASVAGANVRSFYRMRNRDERFKAAMAQAYETGTDTLKAESRRRAVEGWDVPVFGKLQDGSTGVVGHERKYSDRLLELELKRRDPAYRESGNGAGAPVSIQLVSILQLARESGDGSTVPAIVEGHGRLLDAARELEEGPESRFADWTPDEHGHDVGDGR
jgi:hypothetical protein